MRSVAGLSYPLNGVVEGPLRKELSSKLIKINNKFKETNLMFHGTLW